MLTSTSFCPQAPFLTPLLVGLYTEEQLLKLSENSLLKAPGDSWLYGLDKLSAAGVGDGQQGQEVGVKLWYGAWWNGISSDLHRSIEVGFGGWPGLRGVKIGGLERGEFGLELDRGAAWSCVALGDTWL